LTPKSKDSIARQKSNTANLFGGSLSVSHDGTDQSTSFEILAGDDGIGLFTSKGDGSSFGYGGNGAIYFGEIYNIKNLSQYAGQSTSVGITGSAGPIGITAGFAWSDEKNGPGGWFIGWAPGAKLSLWSNHNITISVNK